MRVSNRIIPPSDHGRRLCPRPCSGSRLRTGPSPFLTARGKRLHTIPPFRVQLGAQSVGPEPGALPGGPGPTRGSQGTGVVGNNWSDRVLLSTLYVFKPSHVYHYYYYHHYYYHCYHYCCYYYYY